MPKSGFHAALREAVEQRHSKIHPFSEAWVTGGLNRQILGEWVKQHYHYVGHFSQWCGGIFANCSDEGTNHFLVENIMEEEGFVEEGGFLYDSDAYNDDSPYFVEVEGKRLLLRADSTVDEFVVTTVNDVSDTELGFDAEQSGVRIRAPEIGVELGGDLARHRLEGSRRGERPAVGGLKHHLVLCRVGLADRQDQVHLRPATLPFALGPDAASV